MRFASSTTPTSLASRALSDSAPVTRSGCPSSPSGWPRSAPAPGRSSFASSCTPDPFVVLNSESPAVVANSIVMRESQALLMDLLGQPRSAWAPIEIHGGKGGRAEALVDAIARLPEGIRSRIALENDERCYGAGEIPGICRKARVPMVFDAHHHVVHEELDSLDDPSMAEYAELAAGT